MTKSLKTSTALSGDVVLATIGKIVIKEQMAVQAARATFAAGFETWLEAQSEALRAEIFAFVEARSSAADARKLAVHPLRPEIEPSLVVAARVALDCELELERAEKEQDREAARLEREAAKAEREQQKEAADFARYEALRDRFEAAPEKAQGHDAPADIED